VTAGSCHDNAVNHPLAKQARQCETILQQHERRELEMGSAKMPATHDQALPFHVSPPLSPADAERRRARTMADTVMAYAPATDTDALTLLRAMYPDVPLSLRVVALDLISRRRSARAFHIPR
jgi:hypothetical protein